jgi:signal transduction histidine kinase
MKILLHGLGRRLLISYLAVIFVGTVALILTAEITGPSFIDRYMTQMMGGQAMMQSDPTLRAVFRDALMEAVLVSGATAAFVGVIASLVIARQIVRPVHELAEGTRRIAEGSYEGRVSFSPNGYQDEVTMLAQSFNEMADALEQNEARRLALVGDVAHEMRTPLATLQGNLEGLLDGIVEPTQETWAKLYDEAARLRRLVDDLHELSRAEARQIPLQIAAVLPQEIAQAAVDRLGPQFEEKGLTLKSDVVDGLPYVRADRDRAIQVVTNLLTNALRYTAAGGTVCLETMRDGDEIDFAVVDNGIGIEASDLERIFDRFYRADKSRSRALGGSGIGLTIAKALAESMVGHIEARSAGAGKGSTFIFSLPVATSGIS